MFKESIDKRIGPSYYRDSEPRDPKVINGNASKRTIKEGNNAGFDILSKDNG